MLQNLNLNRTLRNYIAFTGLVAGVFSAHALTLPAQTTIPVAFVHSIDAHKAKTGDVVTAKSMQQVVLAGRAKRSRRAHCWLGISSRPAPFSSTRHRMQNKSRLCLRSNSTSWSKRERRLLSTSRCERSQTPLNRGTPRSPSTLMKAITSGTMYLIGGGQYSPLEKKIVSSDEDEIVGYNKKHGTYARLFAADYTGKQGTIHCDATQSEQAIGIFSPQACGAYGFSTVSLSVDTQTNAFRLASMHDTVKLYAW